jgi:hypothetical protein
MMDVATRVGNYKLLEAKIKEITDAHKAALKPYNDLLAQIEASIIKFLQDNKQQNAKTAKGTAYLSSRVSYRQEDPEQFKRHVIGTEQWDIVDWKANKTAMDAAWNEALSQAGYDPTKFIDPLPPGIVRSEEITLGVLSPSKPRIKAPKKANGGLSDEEWAKIEAEADKELEQQSVTPGE